MYYSGKKEQTIFLSIMVFIYTYETTIRPDKNAFQHSILSMRFKEKEIRKEIPHLKLKYSNFQFHQYGQDDEILASIKFYVHCNIQTETLSHYCSLSQYHLNWKCLPKLFYRFYSYQK